VSCHAKVQPRQEHAVCSSCHESHSGAPGTPAKTCGTCHVKQQKSAARAHADCLGCHTPHEGGKPPPSQCITCHAEQAVQNHGELAQGCGTCHGIHADQGVRAAPACTTCHQVAKLPGLHAQAQHQACNTCHESTHDTGPFSERATCVACHQAQKNHVPEAKLCQGCHVFRR
jgi:hypothetical protein